MLEKKFEHMNHYHILTGCSEQQLGQLATTVLESYPQSQIKLLSGPRTGLVMVRVRETVADSQFNAGELLVTEVKLELADQFGFGMVLGDSPQRALAVALVDAAVRKGGVIAEQLTQELSRLEQEIIQRNRREQELVSSTRVEFERM